MENDLSIFGSFSHQHDYDLLQTSLIPIARNISDRAVMFVDQLFSNLIQGNKILEPFQNWNYTIKYPADSPICSKSLAEKNTYICYDCRQMQTSCICQECFVKGDHEGHNYFQITSDGGCCDCGNQQVWNPRSFCPTHKKDGGLLEEQIEPNIRKQFISQYTLAFYVFFALNQLDVSIKIKQSYGSKLISSLVQNAQKNYQMKILCYQLLEVSFNNQNMFLKQNIQLKILQKIFREQNISNLAQFQPLLFQIFPVKLSQTKVIREYFRKAYAMELHSQHPLKNINYLYMSCVKTISKLIKNNELQPFFLNKQKSTKNVKNLRLVFLQYYWDLEYIYMVKSAKQYQIKHLQMVNIAEMAFYRQYGRINYTQKDVSDIDLDQIYLKMLGHMVKNVINEKQLLLKCIKELFYYVKNEEINIFSQAQERAFALITLAYFDGNISQLFEKQIRIKFVQNFQISKQTFANILKYIITTSLQSISLYGKPQTSRVQDLSEFFLIKNPENNFNYFLDLIYHKILMMISIDYFRYDEIIYETFIKLVGLQDVQRDINGKQLCSLKMAVRLLNTITMVNLDEIVISDYLDISQKQKIYEFYARLLSSFKQLRIKQFKVLALSIITNEQAFEQFIKERTTISKGRLISEVKSRPLETFVYNYIFQSYDRSLLETEVSLLNQVEDRSIYSTINIFNSDTIDLIKQISLTYLLSLQMGPQSKDQSNEIFSQLSMELFKIYFYSRCQSLKNYFQRLVNGHTQKIISENLTKQILIVEKKRQQYLTQTEKMKKEKEIIDKKKRQKIENMRREKSDLIRKKQQHFLMGLQDQMKDQNEQSHSNCIICKQHKQQHLNFVSYINFTDLVEKRILKDNVCPKSHLFLTTCGHRIHQSCYSSVCGNQSSQFCFLCKRESNILVPELSSMDNISPVQKQITIKDFLKPFINGYLNKQNNLNYAKAIFLIQAEYDTFVHFIYGFVRELTYNGLNNSKYFYKSQYHLYYQIFHIIMCRTKSILEQTFTRINQFYNQNPIFLESKLNSLERYIMILVQDSLQIKVNDTNHNFLMNLSQLQIQQAIKIVSYFKTKEKPSLDSSSITDLKMILLSNLFIELPQHLNMLHKKMGQCLQCPNVTDKILMCLLCGWRACLKCQNMLYKHNDNKHTEGSIYIACSTGEINFLYGNIICKDNSIYQNYLGISYSQTTSMQEKQKPYKFKLNHQKLNEIYKITIAKEIHQKIFDSK